MSRTRPAEGPTISLFPFLAVLLCTMGSLLVLLVLFSRSARQGAEATASAELADLELARDSLRWRLDQLATVRERTAADLAEARLQLAGVEEHTRSLADELEGLERTIIQLESAGPRADGSELARLEAALKSARESLDVARARQRTTPAAYAVVPYVGKNGTHRRPLYIECCIDGVFLQPEGVRLSPGDFEGPPGPGNPLACALRAAREHIAKHPDASTDPAAQPYPLLLVRPSGVMAYYAAREAIQSWGSDFGYQLVDEEWTLTFPPRDPALAEVEKRAIAEARERLAWLAEVRPAKTERPVQQYRAATTRGGVVAEGGPSVLGDQSRFEWRNQVAAREGSAGGGLAAGGGRGSGLAAEGVSGAAGDGRGRPLAAGEGDGTDDGGNRGDAILGRGTGRNAGVVGAMAGNAAGQATSAAGQPSADSRDGVPGRDGPADGMAGGSGGRRMGGRYATGSRFGGGSSSGGASGDGDSEGAGGGGGSVSTTALGVPSGTTGGSAGGTPSAGAAGQPAMTGGGAAMPGLAQTGGSPSDGGSASSSATMSFAQARGKNWASLATQDRPVPLTRPIRIECALGELRLLDESGKRVRSRIPIDGDTATAIDPLVKEVHARVSEWGLAGERMYWKPQLVLSATSDGRSRRDDLERLLADSGLDTRHDGHEDEVRSLPPVQPASYLRE